MPQIRAVVMDYDQTLTSTDHLSPDVVASLRSLRAAGVRLVLCTGRSLPMVYGRRGITDPAVMQLFDLVVAESGGVLWNPATDEVRLLGRPPSPRLLKGLADARVRTVEVGATMVNVSHRHLAAALAVARRLGVPLGQVTGRETVELVSPGVCKSQGMRAALALLRIAPRDAVAVGDGPNDVDMLDRSRNGGALTAAVANAVPEIRRQVDIQLHGSAGDGFRELAAAVIRGDLRGPQRALAA